MKSQLEILTFHRVIGPGETYFIPPMAIKKKTFERLLEKLASAQQIINLEDGVRQLKNHSLKGRKIAITFDDGYWDNFFRARQILLRIGVPATFFIPVSPIDKQEPYWWDYLYDVFNRKKTLFFKWAFANHQPPPLDQVLNDLNKKTSESHGNPCRMLVQALNQCTETERNNFTTSLKNEFGPCSNRKLLMSWDEILRLLHDGFSIGSHTISHIPLTDLDPEKANAEIADSACLIEKRLGKKPSGFCYPRGSFAPEHIRMAAQSGYDYAVTTQFGSNFSGVDIFSLKRRNMSDYQGVRDYFPVSMHLLELTGKLDRLLSARRTG